jgi:D-glycero-alpha-D-manno-heptose 1-phosphate guanylyltransferase
LQALILVGGLGTRLRGVVDDRPKPMADIGGKPFLEYLINFLGKYGVMDIILSTGYMSSLVMNHFGDGHGFGVRISYSKEDRPLGTAGAIRQAKSQISDQTVLVMNGDSILDFDPNLLIEKHKQNCANISMALVRVNDKSRYGSVEIDESGKIIEFVEKDAKSKLDVINAGIYLLDRQIVDSIPCCLQPISLEKDIFPKFIGKSFYGVIFEGFFIDIGIPLDYLFLQKNIGLIK